MATVQGGYGRICLFNDFHVEDPIAGTAEDRPFGDFTVGGQGSAEVDSGIPLLHSGSLNGVGRMTTTNEDVHTIAVGTPICMDVALCAPIIMETRLEFNNLDTKAAWFGVCNVDIATIDIETDIVDTVSGGTTIDELTATNMAGFYLTAEITEDEMWHTIWQGGTTSGPTTTTAAQLGVDAVAAAKQILRLEIDSNGDVRWYIDGVLKKTVAAALSTSTDIAAILGVEAQGSNVEEMDVDYLAVEYNRDWTV